MRRATALLPSLLAAGCSLVFVKGPPDPPEPSEEPSCTTSKVLPVLDAIGGTVLGIVAIAALAGDECLTCSAQARENAAEKDRKWALGFTVGSLALFGSAVTGLSRTSRCGEAHELHEAFKHY